jgi:hypothetical protein
MKTFQLPAQLEGYRSLKDRTLKLSFETGELTPEKMADIHYSLNKVGWLAFAPDPFTTQEMSEIDSLKVEFDDTGKTPGQRLRAVFYRCWEQKPEGYKIFNDYYQAQMEKLVNHFKSKLDPV